MSGTSIVNGVTGRYAQALFDLAKEAKAVDSIEADLGKFTNMLHESSDLQAFIKSPAYTSAQQAKALGALVDKAGIKGMAANFFQTVASNRRLSALPAIITDFNKLVSHHRGEVKAEVTSAEPLSDAQQKALSAALKEKLGKEPKIELKIDKSILGGLLIKVGSQMLDTSLKTKLNTMNKLMKEVG